MAKKLIHPVAETEIVKVFSALADSILVRHGSSNGFKRNTHIICGAAPELTSAIFAETVLIDRLLPLEKVVMTFAQPEDKFPDRLASKAKKTRAIDIDKSPLKNEINGGPLSTLLVNSVNRGASASFIDLKLLPPEAGLPIDAQTIYSKSPALIDTQFLTENKRSYIDAYINGLSQEEHTALMQNWLGAGVAGEGVHPESVPGHNLRADYMRHVIGMEMPRDNALIHVHIGTPKFNDVKTDADFFSRKKIHSLSALLKQSDQGANIIVVNFTSNTPVSRQQAAADFAIGRRDILRFDMPVYPAWARQQDTSLPQSVKERGYWNYLCWENKALKYEY